MENLFIFLFRISVSIALFYMLYLLFLRKSTHFLANRIFLISGLIVAVLISLFPIHYISESTIPQQIFPIAIDNEILTPETNLIDINTSTLFTWDNFVRVFYIIGILFVLVRLFRQFIQINRLVKDSYSERNGFYHIHRNSKYHLPFSFFNHIFIHPEIFKQEEIDDIITHELVHIRERHWIDLLIIELLTVILWFNPFIWLYERAIKQNHEYLADQEVITSGKSLVRYQVLLVNQLMGMHVIGMTNNLNFALGPTRLKMMTKQKTPKLKLLYFLWVLPVIALLLTAFAEPEYKNSYSGVSKQLSTQSLSSSQEDVISVIGKVVLQNGEPLTGAHVIINRTTIGTITDENGEFKLEFPKNNGSITTYASFVGYQTNEIQLDVQDSINQLKFTHIMERAVIGINTSDVYDDTPLPLNPYNPSEETYDDDMFVMVEDMPHYPGGSNGLTNYFKRKYKEVKLNNFFEGEKLEGEATIKFTVDNIGKVTNIVVLDSTADVAGKTLASMAAGMEKWQPGLQGKTPVPVDFVMSLKF